VHCTKVAKGRESGKKKKRERGEPTTLGDTRGNQK